MITKNWKMKTKKKVKSLNNNSHKFSEKIHQTKITQQVITRNIIYISMKNYVRAIMKLFKLFKPGLMRASANCQKCRNHRIVSVKKIGKQKDRNIKLSITLEKK